MSRPVNFDKIASQVFDKVSKSRYARVTRNQWEYAFFALSSDIEDSSDGTGFIFYRQLVDGSYNGRVEYICSYHFIGSSWSLQKGNPSFFSKSFDFSEKVHFELVCN